MNKPAKYLEGLEVKWPNLSGRLGNYPDETRGNINIVIKDPNMLEDLQNDGYPIKTIENEDGTVDNLLNLSLNLDPNRSQRKPKVNRVLGDKIQVVDPFIEKDLLEEIDRSDIVSVDVVFSPYDRNHDEVITSCWISEIFIVIDMSKIDQQIDEKWGSYERF